MDKSSHEIKNSDKNAFDIYYDNAVERLESKVCVNDYVKINDTKLDKVCSEYKSIIDEMKKSDLNLKVCKTEKEIGLWYAEVGEEMGMGLYKRVIVLPVSHLDVVSHGIPNGLPEGWFSNKGEDKGYQRVKDTIL